MRKEKYLGTLPPNPFFLRDSFKYSLLFSLTKKEAKKSRLAIFRLKFKKNLHPYPNSLRSNMGTPLQIFLKFLNAKISKVKESNIKTESIKLSIGENIITSKVKLEARPPFRGLGGILFAILFITTTILNAQNTFTLLKEFDTEITNFYTDKLQNIYLQTSNNELIKHIPSFNQEFRFSNKTLGELRHLDTNNPFNLLLFYPEYNTIFSLNRNMIETGRFNLFDLNLLQVDAVAVSSDNHIWLYDELEFKLKKVVNSGDVLVESADLSMQLNRTLRPNFVMEKEQMVYLNDPEIGILIFDIFGQYEKTLEFKNLNEFQILGEELLFVEEGVLKSFHLKSLLVKSVKLPEDLGDFDKIQIRKNRFYVLKDSRLKVYEF